MMNEKDRKKDGAEAFHSGREQGAQHHTRQSDYSIAGLTVSNMGGRQ